MSKISVSFSQRAKNDLQEMEEPQRVHFCHVMSHEFSAGKSHRQPLVMHSLSNSGPIQRVVKDYTFGRPGWRIIFHHITWIHIFVEKICRRDEETYGDGN